MLEQIGTATDTPHTLTWVPEDFLQAQELMPWRDFPAWIPGDPLQATDVSASVAAGLTFRSIQTTARDTIAFEKSRTAEELEGRPFGITREREQEVLAAWHAAG